MHASVGQWLVGLGLLLAGGLCFPLRGGGLVGLEGLVGLALGGLLEEAGGAHALGVNELARGDGALEVFLDEGLLGADLVVGQIDVSPVGCASK